MFVVKCLSIQECCLLYCVFQSDGVLVFIDYKHVLRFFTTALLRSPRNSSGTKKLDTLRD